MPRVQKLLRSTAVYSLSNILNAAIPFLMLPVLTRVLPPSGYGVIAMFSAVLGVVGALTGLGTECAVNVRFVDREELDFPAYVASCLYILLGSTLAALVLALIFSGPITALVSIPVFWLLMAVLVAACNYLCNIRLGIWLMDSQPVRYGSFQVLLSSMNMGLSLAFVLGLGAGHQGRLWGQSAAVALFGLFALSSLMREKLIRFTLRKEYLKEALAFGLPLVPHAVGICLIAIADRFIINWRLGLDQAGIYMVAAQLGAGIAIFSDAFNKAFSPWLFNQLKIGDREAKLRIVKGTWLYFLAALSVAALLAGLSRWIVLLVAGEKFAGAAGALAWQGLGQAFLAMYLVVANYIFYTRKTRPLALVTFLAGGLGLGLTTLLVPVMGISGAGLSFAAATFVRFLLTWYLAQKACPMPWWSWGEAARAESAGEGLPAQAQPAAASETIDT